MSAADTGCLAQPLHQLLLEQLRRTLQVVEVVDQPVQWRSRHSGHVLHAHSIADASEPEQGCGGETSAQGGADRQLVDVGVRRRGDGEAHGPGD